MDFLKLSKLEILTSLEGLIDEYECNRRTNPDLNSLLVKLRKLIVYGDPNDKTFDRNIAKIYGHRNDSSDTNDDEHNFKDQCQYDSLPPYLTSPATATSVSSSQVSSLPVPVNASSSNSEICNAPLANLNLSNDHSKVNAAAETNNSDTANILSTNTGQCQFSSSSYTFRPPLFSSHFTAVSQTTTQFDHSRDPSSSFFTRFPPPKLKDNKSFSDFGDSTHQSSSFKVNNRDRRNGPNQSQSENYSCGVADYDQLCHRCFNPGHVVKDCLVSEEDGKLIKELYFLKHYGASSAISRRKRNAVVKDPVRQKQKIRKTNIRLQRKRMEVTIVERKSMKENHPNSMHSKYNPNPGLFGSVQNVALAQPDFTQQQEESQLHFQNPNSALTMTMLMPAIPPENLGNLTEYQIQHHPSPIDIDNVKTTNTNLNFVPDIKEAVVMQRKMGTTFNRPEPPLNSTTTKSVTNASAEGQNLIKYCLNCRTHGHLKRECTISKVYGKWLKKLIEKKKSKKHNPKRLGVHGNAFGYQKGY